MREARVEATAFFTYCGGTCDSKRSQASDSSFFGRWPFTRCMSSGMRASPSGVSRCWVIASVMRLMAFEMRSEKCGRAPGWLLNSRKRSSASMRASSRSLSSTSPTSSSLTAWNSSSLRSIDDMISYDEQMTPHLLADESFTISTPASSKSFWRASCVMKRLAPSTTSGDDGVPSGRRKLSQLSMFTVFGRPPAGMNASATTRLCMVLRARRPARVETSWMTPSALSLLWSNSASGRSDLTSLTSSAMSRPSGSSAPAVPSAIPTILTRSPYSRSRIRIMLPATSPSVPPVIFSVTASSSGLPRWMSGCMPRFLRAVSRKTCTPSEVTPYVLWLKPESGLDDMKADGIG
mmetsp:Transcript_49324/g.139651  ORF Transcript_49324/g.139651 Transcript_49324/m.139651 type:complete len:349 (+) Transcript_49324:929-1975(+)